MCGGIAPVLELLMGPKTGDAVVGVSGGDVGPTLRGILKFGVVGRMFGQSVAAGRNSCARRIDGVWGGSLPCGVEDSGGRPAQQAEQAAVTSQGVRTQRRNLRPGGDKAFWLIVMIISCNNIV